MDTIPREKLKRQPSPRPTNNILTLFFLNELFKGLSDADVVLDSNVIKDISCVPSVRKHYLQYDHFQVW